MNDAERIAMLERMYHDLIVVMQAAWIEWRHGEGAEGGMEWIENTLLGPGLIPDEGAPYGKEAQAYFDANKADPLPLCWCGRPSNATSQAGSFCSQEHCDQAPLGGIS